MKPNKPNLRKIVVNNENYLWKRGHYHLNEEKNRCNERLIVYLEGYKNTPLILEFKEIDNDFSKKMIWKVGYPDSGVIYFYEKNEIMTPYSEYTTKFINLNLPSVIKEIILFYYNIKWFPKQSALTIKNGLPFVELFYDVIVDYKNLTNLLADALTFTSDFEGGWSNNFESVAEFRSALQGCLIQLNAGDRTQIEKLQIWFAPTCDWDSLIGFSGFELGNKIYELLLKIKKRF